MSKHSSPALQHDLDRSLVLCAELGEFAQCGSLLAQGADPKNQESRALQKAATNGRADCVELLIPLSDPRAANSGSLRWAAARGHVECVKLLIPVSDPKAIDSDALRWAVAHGHVECAKLLLPFSEPKADMLLSAANFGRSECVALLSEHAPHLFNQAHISSLAKSASSCGYCDLAAFILAIGERLSLAARLDLDAFPPSPDRRSSTPAQRL